MVDHAKAEFLGTPKSLSDISAAELIRITRALTRRITNQDRQRLAAALRESGHYYALHTSAPVELQLFFAGEIDLDDELAERFVNAPLLSHARVVPAHSEPFRRQSTATFSSQDDSVSMSLDAHLDPDAQARLEFTFTLFSTFTLRFPLNPVSPADCRRWLDLMRRDSGITFLWTFERWEKPYFIFVVREHFARFYAFSPQGYEASVRLTPDIVTLFCNWLEAIWPDGLTTEPDQVQWAENEGTHHPKNGSNGAESRQSPPDRVPGEIDPLNNKFQW